MKPRFWMLWVRALVPVLGFSFGAAPAQAPYLVKDINLVQDPSAGSNPGGFTLVNGTIYFVANEANTGIELWKSDGTVAGTTLVKDMTPGDASSSISYLTSVNGMLFFGNYDSTHGSELWKSDGTVAGTTLVKDIAPGFDTSGPGNLTNVNGTLFFSATDPVNGQELWKSDGTEAGTVLVKDINPGVDSSSPSAFIVMNGTLFFSAYDPIDGQELWKSDGTEAGTVLVSDINPGPDGSYPSSPALFNGALFFSAGDSTHGTELWKTDGTQAGTVLVQDLLPGTNSTYPFRFTSSGGMLFFVAYDSINSTRAIWSTDGSMGNATLVRGGYQFGSPESLTDVNGTIFFTALNSVTFATELWKSDGTTAGTTLVPTSAPNFSGVAETLVNLDGTLALAAYDSSHGIELWKSDGTDAGTVLIKDIMPGATDSQIGSLTKIGGALWFSANDGVHGPELWTSDGTGPGTAMFEELEPGDASSNPGTFANLNGTAYFFARDPVAGLWRSDGTSAGTVLIGSGPDNPWASALTPLNGWLIGTGQDADHGYELWRTDGTLAGTSLIKDINPGTDWSQPDQFALSNGTLYFRAYDPDHGYELWKTDGTGAGTVLVKDLVPGPSWGSPSSLTDINGTLFFTDQSGTIWRSDGTESGTVPIVAAYYAVGGMTNVSGTGFFFAIDFNTYLYTLWKTDGTDAGTVPVKGEFNFIQNSAAANGKLFFTTYSDTAFALQLWTSDGTDAGTIVMGAAAPWTGPAGLTGTGGRLFFTATDADHGLELYTSDGTEAGTGLVKDINPGPDGSNPINLADIGGVLYFGASDPAHGRELWRSDGTDAGTMLVADIAPGFGGSDPMGVTKVGAHVYFSANGSVFGEPRNRELWAIGSCGQPDDNCNGIDEDCNGIPDDGYVPVPTSCGVGACGRTGATACVAGSVQDTCIPGAPSVEVCDGIDNDCDGLVDEDFPDGCACVIKPTGLVGWWPGDGDTLDIQGGNNGTVDGPLAYVPGRVGQAFRYSLSYPFVDQIGAPSTYAFVQNTGVFTMMAWIRLTDPTEQLQHGVMGNASSTVHKGASFLWENSDGLQRLRLFMTDGTPGAPLIDSYSASFAVTTSGWHHVAAVGDGTHVTFYVDGVGMPGSGAIASLSAGDSSNQWVIGGCGQGCGFNGEIDEAQIYDRALGASEILAIDLAGSHGLCRCADADGDGYGVEGNPACLAGLLPDCDDTSALVHPGAPDNNCDGVDNNCNGQVDEASPWVCQCTMPTGGPFGWWPGDGDANGLRGGLNGMLEGSVTFAPGVVGQAFHLNGIDAFIDAIGDPSSFSFMQNTGVFSIDAWINLDDPGALVDQTITASCLGGSDKGHVFQWQNSGGEQALRLVVDSGTPGSPTYFSLSPNQVITTAGWHHVAVVADGQHVRFHVDGVAFPGTGAIGPLGSGDSTAPLHIGGLPEFYPLEKFAGLIDEVRIWDRALSTSELSALETAGTAGPCRCTDADGDGFGAEGGLTCSRGPLMDCDESTAAVWGAPVEVTNLGLTSLSSATLTWDDQAAVVGPGVVYDVLRGVVNLPVGSAGEACLGAVSGTAASDITMPAIGTGYWYLIRGHNSCGAGTYGTRSNGTPRLSTVCP